ncbi:protein-methionine-sulfoxide reductase heme-binding subunit MsrQ [Tritonibacter horizontis]|uniref:Sulfoxide reductase heme-binding subunit YedZ n=1 Tax=Tritonibacter horizontis TaxID=1768241 RepID=A0A132BTG4_9RHOB|nr:ferric reductase-like transmembrane domain-containing protein [Tritonibacter horizontis]KUP91352.1 sulfoxide reductase heme-binding subunit YedZ [Tritonibacter horizontis]
MPRLHDQLFWFLLSIPAILIAYQAYMSTDPRIFGELAHPAAEFSARLMIIAMMTTPLTLLFKGQSWTRWLRKNRRSLGIASFAYALLHTTFYMIDRNSLAGMVSDVSQLYIIAGWAALAILIPITVTSCDFFVKKLGPRWKTLQRWSHPAVALVLLHWAAINDWAHPAEAILHFAPLLLLQAYRVWYWYLRPRPVRQRSVGI